MQTEYTQRNKETAGQMKKSCFQASQRKLSLGLPIEGMLGSVAPHRLAVTKDLQNVAIERTVLVTATRFEI